MSDEMAKFRRLLIRIRDAGGLLIGSMARGTQSGFSDIDFVVPYVDRTDDYGEPQRRPIDDVVDAIREAGVEPESVIIGSVGTPRDFWPRPVEVMECCWYDESEFPGVSARHVAGVDLPVYRPDRLEARREKAVRDEA